MDMGVVWAMDCGGRCPVYNLGESQPVALADRISALEATLGKQAALRPVRANGCAGVNPGRGGKG
jgi:hypothetical protein